MTDEEILDGCKKNDTGAQKALFDKYSARMMGLCIRYSGNKEEAEDILQDGFIKVCEKLEQYSGKGSLGGWISTVMVNTALVHLRKKKKEGYATDINDATGIDTKDVDVLSKMRADELMELIRRMPSGYRTVFNLFAIEGYGHKEIAILLNVSESTSKSQFFKAKIYLRKQIEKLEKKKS